MRYQNDSGREVPLNGEFDFTYWSDLWQKNPAEFEKQRKAAIAQLIESAPERMQRRLRGIEFEIDVIRRKADSPMESYMRVADKMWHHFQLMNRSLHFDVEFTSSSKCGKKAKVLEITRTKSS